MQFHLKWRKHSKLKIVLNFHDMLIFNRLSIKTGILYRWDFKMKILTWTWV